MMIRSFCLRVSRIRILEFWFRLSCWWTIQKNRFCFLPPCEIHWKASPTFKREGSSAFVLR